MYWFPWRCVNAFIVHNVFLSSMENTDRFLRKELFISLQNNLVCSHTAGYCNEITSVQHIINKLLLLSLRASLQVLLKLVLLTFQQWRTIKASWKKWKQTNKKETHKTVRGILHYSYIKEKIYVLELLSCHCLANCETVVGNESDFFFLLEKQMTHKNGLLAQEPVEQELIKKKQINHYKNLIVVTF